MIETIGCLPSLENSLPLIFGVFFFPIAIAVIRRVFRGTRLVRPMILLFFLAVFLFSVLVLINGIRMEQVDENPQFSEDEVLGTWDNKERKLTLSADNTAILSTATQTIDGIWNKRGDFEVQFVASQGKEIITWRVLRTPQGLVMGPPWNEVEGYPCQRLMIREH